MPWLNYTYWGGSFECCDECTLEPCQCCCYNLSNQALYNASDPVNRCPGAICPNLETLCDWDDFDGFDCEVPTDAECPDLESLDDWDDFDGVTGFDCEVPTDAECPDLFSLDDWDDFDGFDCEVPTDAECPDLLSLDDWSQFDGFDCSAPPYTCPNNTRDQSTYDGVSCSGDILTTGDTPLSTSGSFTSFNLGNAQATDIDFEWHVISCHPAARWKFELDHTANDGTDLRTIVGTTGNSNSHYSGGVFGVCYDPGFGCVQRKWKTLRVAVNVPQFIPNTSSYRGKWCLTTVVP